MKLVFRMRKMYPKVMSQESHCKHTRSCCGHCGATCGAYVLAATTTMSYALPYLKSGVPWACNSCAKLLVFTGPATVVHLQCLMQMQNCRMAYWGWGWGVDETPHPQPQLCLQCLMHCKHCVRNVLCIANTN